MVLDVVRYAVGTLTAIPVRPPRTVDRRVAVAGILVAPLAVLPLGAAVTLVLLAGRELGLAPLATAAAAVGVLALGSRAFHLDGLSDTADALASSYDAERALEVMKRGDAGPAGASALVLVLAVQVGALSALASTPWGPVLAGILVCVSRGLAVVLWVRGLRPARSAGLASSYVGTVHPATVACLWLVLTTVLAAAFVLAGLPWWRGPACAAAGLLVAAWLARRAVRRFGGVAGDVFGAAIEVGLALMLLAAT